MASPSEAPVDSDTKKRRKNTSLLQAKTEEVERENQRRLEVENKEVAEVKAKARELKKKLTSMDNPEERVAALQAQFNAATKENKRLENEVAAIDEEHDGMVKERDRLKADLTKSKDSAVTLENLCRELQKSKNMALEESRRVANEAEQRHADLSNKFRATLNEITEKMEIDGDDKLKQMKETQMAKAKLLSFMEQYEIREKEFSLRLQKKDTEVQLAEAKLAQQTEITRQLSIRAQEYEKRTILLTQVERDLRAQLDMYKEKFQDFQAMMEKSNDLLTTFKDELDKNAKRIVKLEQEKHNLSGQHARTELKLIEATKGEKTAKSALGMLQKKEDRLQSLCRALQKQNGAHRKLIVAMQELGTRLSAKFATGAAITAEDIASLIEADFTSADEPEPTMPPEEPEAPAVEEDAGEGAAGEGPAPEEAAPAEEE